MSNQFDDRQGVLRMQEKMCKHRTDFLTHEINEDNIKDDQPLTSLYKLGSEHTYPKTISFNPSKFTRQLLSFFNILNTAHFIVNRGQLIYFGKDAKTVSRGKNVALGSEEKRVFAQRTGQLVWKDDVAYVLPVQYINSRYVDELDPVYNGTVYYDGDIERSQSLNVTGDLWINGGIQGGDVCVGGNIITSGGVHGREGGTPIECGGTLYTNYIERSQVKVGGDLVVKSDLIRSKVKAGRYVLVAQSNGRIAGGEIKAMRAIYAHNIGSDKHRRTVVAAGVGQSGGDSIGIADLQSEQEKLNEKIAKRKKAASANNNPDKLSGISDLAHKRSALNERIEWSTEYKSQRHGTVYVPGRLHYGTKVVISGVKKQVDDNAKCVKFNNVNGRIAKQYFDWEESSGEINLTSRPTESLTPTSELSYNVPVNTKHALLPGYSTPILAEKREQRFLLGVSGNREIVFCARDARKEDSYWALAVISETSNEVEVRKSYSLTPFTVLLRFWNKKKAVKRAAKYYNRTENDIGIKVIADGEKPFLNIIGGKPHLIRAKLRDCMEGEEYDPPNKRWFRFDNDPDDGLVLEIDDECGSHTLIALRDVWEYAQNNQYEDIIWEKVRKALTTKNKRTVVGPYQTKEEDGEVVIKTDDEGQKAYMLLRKANEGGRPVHKTDALAKLKARNIDYNEYAIREAFRKKGYGKKILIAEGRAPEDGVDGKLEIKAPCLRTKGSKVFENEDSQYATPDNLNRKRSPYPEAVTLVGVKSGDAIAQHYEAKQGADGYNIYGEKLPATGGNEVEYYIGSNIKQEQDKLYAEKNGVLILRNNTLHVRPLLYVPDDLSKLINTIEYSGEVVINGTIPPGATLKVEGSIEVYGVNNATLEANDNIIVHDTIDESEIDASDSVYSKTIKRSTVSAKNIFAHHIINSDCVANQKIITTYNAEEDGIVKESTLTAKNTLNINCVGDNTTLLLGVQGEELKEMQKSHKIIKKAEKKVTKLENTTDKIDDQDKKIKMQQRAQTMRERIARRRKKIKNKLDRYDCDCNVHNIETPTTIAIHNQKSDIEKPGLYKLQDGGIVRVDDALTPDSQKELALSLARGLLSQA